MTWISIDDRLPPIHVDVLVYNGIKCSVSFYEPPMNSPFQAINASKGWRWDWSEEDYEYDKITHWMELPKTPNED